jgi:hypothetical protein
MIDGVVRAPSAFSTTLGALFSTTETHEFVVPKSIPIIFPIIAPKNEIVCCTDEYSDTHYMGSKKGISRGYRAKKAEICLFDAFWILFEGF